MEMCCKTNDIWLDFDEIQIYRKISSKIHHRVLNIVLFFLQTLLDIIGYLHQIRVLLDCYFGIWVGKKNFTNTIISQSKYKRDTY